MLHRWGSVSPGMVAKGGRVVSRVLFVYRGRRAVIYLGRPSPDASSSLPAARTVRVAPRRLFGLAPIGGYRATAVTSGAVGSYPTFSPLPTEMGGMFSVALSVALRRPGVTWQSSLWSSDFPRGPKAPRPPHPTPSHQVEDNAPHSGRKGDTVTVNWRWTITEPGSAPPGCGGRRTDLPWPTATGPRRRDTPAGRPRSAPVLRRPSPAAS